VDEQSRYFRLECGRPQGDNVSPNSFNFSVQILIFKIELDPRIKAIPRNILRADADPDHARDQDRAGIQNNNHFSGESRRETSKNESLADDNSTLTLLQEESIFSLKDILTEFGDLSGLRCNFEKTCIMPSHPTTPDEDEWIARSNFKCVNNITLLGINIKRDLDNVDAIFEKIRQKIINLAAYWSRFSLSLPGRITISKTFLISQLNYVACWLKPSQEMLTSIETIVNNFTKGNLNIANDRIYKPVDEGGIGLFNLELFFHAQCCSWVARTKQRCIDNWRFDLTSYAPGNNILNIRSVDFDRQLHPILSNIVESYEILLENHTKVNNNRSFSVTILSWTVPVHC
jgi:hypothetical protein